MRLRVTLLVLLVSVAATAGWTAKAAGRLLVPESIAFWNTQDGLIGSGGYCEFATCPGSISVTHDGGRTSRIVLRTAKSVEWVTVADDVAWGTAGPALLRSDNGGRTWRTIGRGIAKPSFADDLNGLAIAPPCYAPGCPSGEFVRTSDGGRTWHRLARQCPRGAGSTAAAAISAQSALLLCDGQPGTGFQGKLLYGSDDGWRTWHVLADVAILGIPKLHVGQAGLSGYGYAAGPSVRPDGAGVLWQERGAPIYVTVDGGHHWHAVPQFRPDDDFAASACVSPAGVAALVERPTDVYRLVVSASVLGRWRAVRSWHLR
jgi:hypothetical protein